MAPCDVVMDSIRPIWQMLSGRRRNQLYGLFVLSILSAGAEVANLGTLLPFLKVLANPEHNLAVLGPWSAPLHGFNRLSLLLVLGGGFLLVIGLSSLLRVATIVSQLRLTAQIGADLGQQLLSTVLARPYRWHLGNNSSQTIGLLTKDISNVVDAIQGWLSLGINGLVVVLLMAALLGIAPLVMSLIALSVGSWYLLVYRFTKAGLKADGEVLSNNHQRSIQTSMEALGGIRDILLNRSQPMFVRQFDRQNRACRLAYGRINMRAQAPRYLIEGFTLGVIVLLSLVLSWQGHGVERQLPLLGTVALGAYRILQPLQQCFGSYSSIQAHQVSCERVIADLAPRSDSGSTTISAFATTAAPNRISLPSTSTDSQLRALPAPQRLQPLVRFEHVDFGYQQGEPWVLHNIDLEIRRGQCIGLIGGTGGGKSTLIDLLLGLLEPVHGRVCIEGLDLHRSTQSLQAWQRRIAHVPQHIHLSDGSFAENIAFGDAPETIDAQRLACAAKAACIAELIEQQRDGYAAVVGERGLRLSGGQRQRLGLARALYRDADVLILDEATSALDNLTEHQVMRSLHSGERQRTVVLVAHRLSTVQDCDTIHLLDHGVIKASGSFAELERSCPAFQALLAHQQL